MDDELENGMKYGVKQGTGKTLLMTPKDNSLIFKVKFYIIDFILHVLFLHVL
jgi:hypothetical protein